MEKKHYYNVADLFVSILMIVVASYGVISGIGFGVIENGRPYTGFQPVFSGTLLLVSSVCLFVQTIKEGNKLKKQLSENPDMMKEEDEKRAAEEEASRKDRRDTETKFGIFLEKLVPNAKIRYALIYFILILVLIKIIESFGMYFGLFLLNFVILKFVSKYSWIRSIVYAAVITLCFYAVFGLILGLNVPKFMNVLR